MRIGPAPPPPSTDIRNRRTVRWNTTKRREPVESWLLEDPASGDLDDGDVHFAANATLRATEAAEKTQLSDDEEILPKRPMGLRESVFAAHEAALARALEGRLAGPGGEGFATRIREELRSIVAPDGFVRARDILSSFRSVGLDEISAKDVADLCMGLAMDSRGHVDGRELLGILNDVADEMRSGPTLRPSTTSRGEKFPVELHSPVQPGVATFDTNCGPEIFSTYPAPPARDYRFDAAPPPDVRCVIEEGTHHQGERRRDDDQLRPARPTTSPPFNFAHAARERHASGRRRNMSSRENIQNASPPTGYCQQETKTPRRWRSHLPRDKERCYKCDFHPCRCNSWSRYDEDDPVRSEMRRLTVEESDSIIRDVTIESEDHGLPSGAAYLGMVLEKVPPECKSRIVELIEADKKRGARALADEIRNSGKDIFGDGSRRSFHEACRRLPRRWTTKTVDRLFDLIDADNDGTVSKREQLVFTKNHSRWILQAFPPSLLENEMRRLVRFEPLIRALVVDDECHALRNHPLDARRKLLSVVRDVASRVRKKVRGGSVDMLRSALSAIERQKHGAFVRWPDFMDFLRSRHLTPTLSQYEENITRRLLERKGSVFDWRSFLDLVEAS